jgi:VanZ family protein
MHKTSAWPLSWVYIALVVYASLYPFAEWRDQGIAPWAFLSAPFPKYWTGFDVAINVVGYAPLGFLLALSVLRTRRSTRAIWLALVAGSVLSFTMETLQSYLPTRVPSNVDWALNTAGTWLGAIVAVVMEKGGAIDHWSRFRGRWFVADARGGLVLLALWPVALLFPAAVPLGLGQVMERLEAGVAEMLMDTPFLEWLPVREVELQPLLPGAELLCVLLGALVPCLLGFCIIRTWSRRVLCVLAVMGLGVAVSALSAALSYGPAHAWEWLDVPVQIGLATAAVLALLLTPVPRRASAALVLLSLGLYLALLNQAPASPYFAQTLQTWEQGRFVRFNGLAQWLGWLWPYGTLVYALSQAWDREPKT